jgi:8-oxo-dGTP pyrophosphatase MutT (NUDIX family)
MAHINKLIDFTIAVYIVYQNKVLLIHHKQLLRWLPIGGHIELHEDPEEALFREIQEECGLEVEVVGTKPMLSEEGTKSLLSPTYLNIHDIQLPHRHVGFIYFAKAKTAEVSLAAAEHNAIRWFNAEELSDPQYSIVGYIRYYAEHALKHFREGGNNA